MSQNEKGQTSYTWFLVAGRYAASHGVKLLQTYPWLSFRFPSNPILIENFNSGILLNTYIFPNLNSDKDFKLVGMVSPALRKLLHKFFNCPMLNLIKISLRLAAS